MKSVKDIFPPKTGYQVCKWPSLISSIIVFGIKHVARQMDGLNSKNNIKV